MFTMYRTLRVLIVDSYADAADSMALLLAHWGHEVRIAYSGPEALAVARQFRPNVVLTEIKLDGLDGFQLAERLHREHRGAVQIIALTGLGGEAQRRRARQCGIRSYLLKPVEPERLHRLLYRIATTDEDAVEAPCGRQTTQLRRSQSPVAVSSRSTHIGCMN